MNVRIKNIINNTLLMILSLVIFFGLFEVITRTRYTPLKFDTNYLYKYDPKKVFTLKENFEGNYDNVTVKTNSFGYRSPEISLKKKKGTTRILVLGDSITYGNGIESNFLFTQLLEDRLNRSYQSKKFEVINTGCPGNASLQEYYDLKRGLKFKPDYVILQFVLNDVTEPNYLLKRYGGTKDYHRVPDIPPYDYFLSKYSSTYIFLKDIITRIKFKTITKKGLVKKVEHQDEYKHVYAAYAKEKPHIKAAWDEYTSWFLKISALCKKNKIPLLLLISPYRFEFEILKQNHYWQTDFVNLCKKEGIICIDATEILKEKFKNEVISMKKYNKELNYYDTLLKLDSEYKDIALDFWYKHFKDTCHLKRNGHIIYTDILFNKLSELINE